MHEGYKVDRIRKTKMTETQNSVCEKNKIITSKIVPWIEIQGLKMMKIVENAGNKAIDISLLHTCIIAYLWSKIILFFITF